MGGKSEGSMSGRKVEDAMAEDVSHIVVINDEEQYSIWPAWKELPRGWEAEGTRGSEDECVEHIESVWTDMRPRSLRTAHEQLGASGAGAS